MIGGPGAVGEGLRWLCAPDRRRAMPRAYSTDLRERVLAACEAGEGSQARIAERYRVGERTLSAWLRAARRWGAGGRRWPPWSRGGTTPPWPSTPTCWPSARACAAAPRPCAGP